MISCLGTGPLLVGWIGRLEGEGRSTGYVLVK
jgi:hypothetical protein